MSSNNSMGGGMEDSATFPMNVVGEAFIPGSEGNATIGELLGYETKFEGRSAYARDGNGWIKLPNYCAKNSPERDELLEERVESWTVLACEGGFSAVAVVNGLAVMTEPTEKKEHALAKLLHFALDSKSVMT